MTVDTQELQQKGQCSLKDLHQKEGRHTNRGRKKEVERKMVASVMYNSISHERCMLV